MKRSMWFWICFVITIILATYFSTRIIMTCMGHGNAALVHKINISADSDNTDLNSLVAAAGIAHGANVYSLDLDEINKRISSIPDVRLSAVRRLPNGNLSIKVSLYRPVALWTDGINYYPLSGDGTIVKSALTPGNNTGVVFRGEIPGDITEIAKFARNLGNNLKYMEFIENRRWNLHMVDGIVVYLPENDPVSAINSLVLLNTKHNLFAKDITVIDMRDNARILVK